MKTQIMGRRTCGGIALSFALAAALAGCNNNGSSGTGTGVINTGGGSDAIATVNGEGITRDQVRSILETTNGPQILSQLVQMKLIEQEVKKQNITLPEAQIQAGYDEAIAKQGQQETFKRLTSTDEGKALIRRQVAAQIGVDYLLTKDIKVDEAKLKAWFEKRKADYGSPAQLKFGVLTTSTKVRADTMTQQLKSKSKTFAQLVEEQKKANDPAAQISTDSQTIPASQIKQSFGTQAAAVEKLNAGEVSPPLAVGNAAQPLFVIFKVIEKTAAKTPDLATMRARIEQDYKLEQVVRAELKNNFDAAVKQVQTGLSQQAMQQAMQQPGSPPATPSYRDVLQTLATGAKAKILQGMRTGAKIDVPDTLYASVAQEFQPTPAPGAAATGAGATGGAPAAGAPAGGAASTPAAGNTAQ